ncbi:uncharacterized protein LOC131231131 isoform X2 [Magnolia sinica]|nr:uncharacterized protein LOC131231131 isoform X2 [Magnolia sinica]
MECNKEEAIRAKDIAEKKMQNKDFAGAQKIALKAQRLYPALENISQMLTVCEVHISAELNVCGSEMDWYGILQVEQSADEVSIKKQYRKLALVLHPDKNKFAGAESAFKLIGEAHRMLTDQAKRYLYDIKRRANTRTSVPRQAPQQQNRNSCAKKPPVNQNNFMNHASSQFPGSNQVHQQQPQAPPTFWTACPFCSIKYQYYRTIMNRALRCQNCLKPFIAYDTESQGSSGANTGGAANCSAVPQAGQTARQQCGTGFQGNVSGGSAASKPFAETGTGAQVGGRSQGNVAKDGNARRRGRSGAQKPEEVNKRAERVKPSGNVNRKRERKTVMESSKSCDSDRNGVEVEDMEEDADITSSRYPRRSGREKQNVIYEENGSDDDGFGKPPNSKRSRGRGESGSTNDQSDEAFSKGGANKTTETVASENEEEQENVPLEESLPNGKEQKASSPKAKLEPEVIDYPEPEFYDFDKERELGRFEVNQIWASYDDSEGMPRFYAWIRRIYTTKLKVQITWLEANPRDQVSCDWVEEELPYACGYFKTGGTEDAELAMFSHLASCEKLAGRGNYKIYPRKGDIWALFKGWDIGWSSDPNSHRQYEYEIVEVLCDYSEQAGVEVAYLVKLKGFISLFQKASNKEINSFQIPPHEILRFSHRIPHHGMMGDEREDVPKGSFELDPASVPRDIEEVALPKPSKVSNYMAADSDGLDTRANCTPVARHVKCKTPESTKVNEKNAQEKENPDIIRRSPRERNGLREKKANQATTSHHAAESGKHSDVEMGNQDGFPDDRCREENSTKSVADEKGKHLDAGQTTSVDSAENHSCSPPTSPVDFEYPDAEFHVFETDKSEDKFEVGDVWALYSKEDDGMPKYYAKIKEVESDDFQVHATWLEACPSTLEETRWSKKDLPITCGRYRPGGTEVFDSTQAFSHRVEAEYVSKWRRYDIYPRKGEVWAVYKHWSAQWTRTTLKNKYDMVEVVEDAGSVFKVLVLEMVDGFKTVFKGAGTTMVIQRNELLRFSHRVPAIMLKDEGGGKLRGYWELDPAAMPTSLFCSTSS